MDDSTIICDEAIKSYDEERKTTPTHSSESNQQKAKFLYFTCVFINYRSKIYYHFMGQIMN